MAKGKQELSRIIPMLNASPRARNLMEGWTRIVQFNLEGEDKPFHIIVDHGLIEMREGTHQQPNIKVSGTTEEFARVILGEKDITHPLLFGQLRLDLGKNIEMITFSRILSAVTRKWGV